MSKKERVFLKTKKYDVSEYDTPETHWDFYDAFNSSKQSVLAISKGDNSIEGENLEKYLKLSLKSLRKELEDIEASYGTLIREPYRTLAYAQDSTGRWESLEQVLSILSLPLDLRVDNATPWEQATAFALAEIRQQVESFPALRYVHDKGMKWFRTAEVIAAAREVIASARYDATSSSRYVPAASLMFGVTTASLPSQDINSVAAVATHTSDEAIQVNGKDGESAVESPRLIDKLDVSKATVEPNFELELGLKDTWTSHIHSVNFKPSYKLRTHPKPVLGIMTETKLETSSSVSPSSRGMSQKSRSRKSLRIQDNREVDDGNNNNTLLVPPNLTAIERSWIPDTRLNSRGSIYDRNFDSRGMQPSVYQPINHQGFHEAMAESDNRGSSSRGTMYNNDSSMRNRSRGESGKEDDLGFEFQISSMIGSGVESFGRFGGSLKNKSDGDESNDEKEDDHENGDDEASVGDLSVNTASTTDSEGSYNIYSNTAEDNQEIANALASLSNTQELNSKVAKLQSALDSQQLEIIQNYLRIEQEVGVIERCFQRSVDEFNKHETTALRNKVFEELTARLGGGSPPVEGYYDWRKNGVQGLRPLLFPFFRGVHQMALLRLDIMEALNPTGKLQDYGDSADRWSLIWDGQDIVHRVLHIMDFLRESRELSDWYGRKFAFLGNPFFLPFNLKTAKEELLMSDKVKEHLSTRPYLRLFDEKSWRYQQFLHGFRDTFNSLIDDNISFNWPKIELGKELSNLMEWYYSFLVIYIRCDRSVTNTYNYEKKFVALIGTVRGRSLLVGEDGVKIPKQLNIPPGRLAFLKTEEEKEADRKAAEEKARLEEEARKLKEFKKAKREREEAKKKMKVFDANGNQVDTEKKPVVRLLKRMMKNNNNDNSANANGSKSASNSGSNSRSQTPVAQSRVSSDKQGQGKVNIRNDTLAVERKNKSEPSSKTSGSISSSLDKSPTKESAVKNDHDALYALAEENSTELESKQKQKTKKAKSSASHKFLGQPPTKEALAQMTSRKVSRLPGIAKDEVKMTRRVDDSGTTPLPALKR